jgi:hypothetical protein
MINSLQSNLSLRSGPGNKQLRATWSTAAGGTAFVRSDLAPPDRTGWWLLSGEGESASGPDSTVGATSEAARPTDELAERIGRLTDAQRAALLDFLRVLQEG